MKKAQFYVAHTWTDFRLTWGKIFQKDGHWFSVRENKPDNDLYLKGKKRWIVSDLPTGAMIYDAKTLKEAEDMMTAERLKSVDDAYKFSTERDEKLKQMREIIYAKYRSANMNDMADRVFVSICGFDPR